MILMFSHATETCGKRNLKREMPLDKALFLMMAALRTA